MFRDLSEVTQLERGRTRIRAEFSTPGGTYASGCHAGGSLSAPGPPDLLYGVCGPRDSCQVASMTAGVSLSSAGAGENHQR